MISKTQIGVAVGVLLLMSGTLLFAGGNTIYKEECEPGTELIIEKTSSPDTIIQFEQLSPTEQRIFLEAYTDDGVRTSDRYSSVNWSNEWFNLANETAVSISYRGQDWELTVASADCGIPLGKIMRKLGVRLGIIGIVVTLSFASHELLKAVIQRSSDRKR